MLTQIFECRRSTRRIVDGINLSQHYLAAAVQLNRHGFTFGVGGLDFLSRGNEIHIDNVMIKLTRVLVALGRTLVIVERHTRANHVHERKPVMHQCALNQRHKLFLVARKASRNVRGAKAQSRADRVNRLLLIRLALFWLAAKPSTVFANSQYRV